MIDWIGVLFHSFWITGLALILAAFSYSRWRAIIADIPLRDEIRQSSFSIWGWLGLALVTLGLAGTGREVWEIVIWTVFTAINLFFAFQSWRSIRLTSFDQFPNSDKKISQKSEQLPPE